MNLVGFWGVSLSSAPPVSPLSCKLMFSLGFHFYVCADIPTSHGFWGKTRCERAITLLNFIPLIIMYLYCCHVILINCWPELPQNSTLHLLVSLFYCVSAFSLPPMLNPVCCLDFLCKSSTVYGKLSLWLKVKILAEIFRNFPLMWNPRFH
jgi:hypothetical protein